MAAGRHRAPSQGAPHTQHDARFNHRGHRGPRGARGSDRGVSAAELQMGRDGHGLDLVPRALDRTALEQLLRAHDPELRLRRAGGRLSVGWSDAERLADNTPEEVEWTPDAVRALENRRHVRKAAGSVVLEAQRLM